MKIDEYFAALTQSEKDAFDIAWNDIAKHIPGSHMMLEEHLKPLAKFLFYEGARARQKVWEGR